MIVVPGSPLTRVPRVEGLKDFAVFVPRRRPVAFAADEVPLDVVGEDVGVEPFDCALALRSGVASSAVGRASLLPVLA